MSEVHRSDTPERKHYTVDRKSLVDIKPTLVYSGTLSKSQDWRDSEHSHYFLEILYIVDGKGIVEIDKTPFNMTKNDIIIYNADVKHFEHSSSDEPLEVDFIAFDKIQVKDLAPNCILPSTANCIYNASDYADTLKFLFDLIRNEITDKDKYYAEIVKDVLRTLLMYIFRVINRNLNTVALHNKDNIMNIVLPYIENNFLSNIGLSEIADECFVNKYYLSHVFTESFGMSVEQYIRSKKIEFAQKCMIETDMAISDIANQCGFTDPAYFDRQFKKATGVTPVQYRKANKSAE